MAGAVNKCYLLSWVMVITLSYVNYGFGIVYFNSFTEMIYKQFKSQNINVVEGENLFNSIVSTMIPAGALIGTLVGGYLAGRGRRYAIILLDICLMFGIVLTVTPNFYLLCLGRFIYGMYIGAICISCPLFVEEISPKEQSGPMGTFTQIMITVGFIIAYCLGFLVPYEYTKEGAENKEIYTSKIWKWIFLAPILIAGLQLLLLICIFRYDSPRYYHLIGDNEKKQMAMKKVSDEDYLDSGLDNSNVLEVTFCQLFTRSFRCALSIGCILVLFNQLTGANAIAFYSNKIFIRGREGYEAEHDARIGTLCLGIGTFAASSFTYILTEYFPKKGLLLIGFICMSITFAILCPSAFFEIDSLIVIFTCVFMIFFNISVGTLIAPYNAQILPDKGVSISQFLSWFLVVLISSFTEQGFEYLKAHGMYLLFFGTNFIGFIFTYIFVRETKGVDKSRLLKLYLNDYDTTAQQEYQHLTINLIEENKENDHA